MKPINLKNMHRTGLRENIANLIPARHSGCRLTIPVREALEASGAEIVAQDSVPGGPQVHAVRPGAQVPPGIIVALSPDSQHLCLRLEIEPEWPGEMRAQAYWQQVDFTPCPACGAPLIWFEAGYVPGYRVCAGPAHHHWLVS